MSEDERGFGGKESQNGGSLEKPLSDSAGDLLPEDDIPGNTSDLDQSFPPTPELASLPERYVVSATSEGTRLTCRDAPNVVVEITRGLTVSAANARKAESGSIFLDGAAQEAPFLDTEREVYNLDHHAGCIRSFTLSTCEQVYVLIRKGLNLRDREWKVFANDPDLDTVFSIWLLLNHRHMNHPKEEIRRTILPLVRLEGVIDVHGLELEELACLSEEAMRDATEVLRGLQEEELAIKRSGKWGEIDFADYTAKVLRQIDHMVFTPSHFEGFEIVDEIMRVSIGPRQIAVVCKSDSGIYEIERQLLSVHGPRLGIIALQKNDRHYTLRQVDLFLPTNLQRVYSKLNLMDPAANDKNRWGGSDSIGGSPKHTGTLLEPEQIATAIEQSFKKPTFMQIVSRVAMAFIAVLASLVAAWTFSWFWPAENQAHTIAFSASALVFLLVLSWDYPRMYGLRLPVGSDWALLFLMAMAGGLMGGTWLPKELSISSSLMNSLPSLAVGIGLPLSAELIFRGVAHGLLAQELRPQRSGGHWFISWPVLGSTFLYVLTSVAVLHSVPAFDSEAIPWLANPIVSAATVALGAALFGLACGMARERSESLLVPIFFHWLTAGFLAAWWMG